MRLIDADALKESLKQSKEACKTWYDNCDSDMKPRVEQALITFMECIIRVNDMPTIEERKNGEWIIRGKQMVLNLENAREQYSALGYTHRNIQQLQCSECRKITLVDESILYEYCPHCGACMRGQT